MERLVDRYLGDEALVQSPLHRNQHAYQAGKSTETALHQLVVRVDKALEQRDTALGVFLDIEGAFNNTLYDPLVLHWTEMESAPPSGDGSEPPWRANGLLRL
jgi:hypothetical protein